MIKDLTCAFAETGELDPSLQKLSSTWSSMISNTRQASMTGIWAEKDGQQTTAPCARIARTVNQNMQT